MLRGSGGSSGGGGSSSVPHLMGGAGGCRSAQSAMRAGFCTLIPSASPTTAAGVEGGAGRWAVRWRQVAAGGRGKCSVHGQARSMPRLEAGPAFARCGGRNFCPAAARHLVLPPGPSAQAGLPP